MIDNRDMKMRLVVEVKAHLNWLNPPATKTEELLRGQANIMVDKAAFDVREIVALIISLLLAERAPNVKSDA
jgi:hypothetical protein